MSWREWEDNRNSGGSVIVQWLRSSESEGRASGCSAFGSRSRSFRQSVASCFSCFSSALPFLFSLGPRLLSLPTNTDVLCIPPTASGPCIRPTIPVLLHRHSVFQVVLVNLIHPATYPNASLPPPLLSLTYPLPNHPGRCDSTTYHAPKPCPTRP